MRKTGQQAPEDAIKRHNPHVEVRPSIPEDFKKFYSVDSVPFTARSVSFFFDGELKGCGGVRFEQGYFLAFSDFDESVKVNSATIYRCALEVMKIVKDMKTQTFAVAKNLDKSARLLKRLGWTHYKSEEGQEIYAYG